MSKSVEIRESQGHRDPKIARALRELEPANAFSHSHRTFRAHLIGTWTILRQWQQRPVVCRAGLFHSAYSTSFYPHALFNVRARERVRELIGTEAEALVFKFCAVDREALWEVAPPGRGKRSIVLPSRFDPGHQVHLSRSDIYSLALIESANLAEQCRAADHGPEPWMSRVFDLWTRIPSSKRPWGRRPVRLAWHHESASIELYRRACRQQGVRACRTLDLAIRANPWAAEPRLLRALLGLAEGDTRRCLEESRRARELLMLWHVPWDKRASLDDWMTLAEALAIAD